MNRIVRRGWLAFVAALALAGCAGTPGSGPGGGLDSTMEPQTDAGPVIGEVSAPRERARAHTELAAAYYERGNMGVALEELRIAIAADSGYAPAYNVLGLVHMDLKEHAQAQASFERALRITPNDPDANHNFGWFLCQTQREEQAIKHFMMAIRNPLYVTPQKSYTLAGDCAVQKSNDRDAADYYQRALRLDPNYLQALIGLAKLRYRRGELDGARTLVGHYNRLIEPTAESLWLALRVERRLGDKSAETSLAAQLRRRFPGSREYQDLQKGSFE